MAQLEQLVARLHSSLLDRSRPLWEVYVIDGLADGRIGYYTKAHHSGIDGKAGVELARTLYDGTPQVREVPPPRRRSRRSGDYQLGVAELLRAAVSNSFKQYVKVGRLLPTAVKALGAARKATSALRKPKGERSLSLRLAPRTIFNTSITNQRSYATMTVPLEETKALGRRVGGTVNTIVMAMCAGALRRFLRERRQLPAQPLIAAVPVSLRGANDDSMNNQVSGVRVDLATDIADAAERFKAIHASSEAAKKVVSELKPVLGADMPVLGSPWLMSGLASLFGRSNLASRLPPAANVVISNVPGVPTPLYMAGAKMLHFYPVSIPTHGLAVNITVQSYAGKLEFGITACRRVLSQDEAHELMGYMVDALDEIRGFDSVAEPDPIAAPGPGAEAPTVAPARAKRKPAAAGKAATKTRPARPPRPGPASAPAPRPRRGSAAPDRADGRRGP
jgi:WS/DGAT/MGAT family acyltransferase